ncbi:MAG: S-methyl-5-thioribose-1-phosphate isomerase [bacterium]|nr:S-methyl-5-thioribose-1-phosphate isomerase [bacterium]
MKAIEWMEGSVRFIDQTELPGKLEYIVTTDYRVLIEAIKMLRVRGAPLIGITAAYAAVLAAKEGMETGVKDPLVWTAKAIKEIGESRPTARNLFFALERMKKVIDDNGSETIGKIYELMVSAAMDIEKEDEKMCLMMGEYGSELIKDGFGIITHCNTGMLVTAGQGTALGVVYHASRQNKKLHVYADETRPLLQGARLTTWECRNYGIPVTLICDNAAATVVRQGKVNCAIVGADRIAANGDTANKIGTYNLALICKAHNVPFYVAAPYSTFDFSLKTGNEIPIEERKPDEIVKINMGRIAPEGIDAYNPAFDVTPAELISAIITEEGVFKQPYGEWKKLNSK